MNRKTEALSLLVILAAAFFLLREPILFGKSFCAVDTAKYKPWSSVASETASSNNVLNDQVFAHFPRKIAYSEAIRSGHLPRWADAQMNGFPIGSDPHYGWYDPFNLLFAAMSVETASIVLAFFQLFLGGAFAYLFLREIGLRPGAAAFGGIAFLGQPFFMTHLTMPTNIQSAFWLPLLLYLCERAIKSARPARIMLVSAPVMALAILGGFPPTFSLAIAAWGCYVVLRLLLSIKDDPINANKAKVLKAFVVTAIIGAMLASIQLFPTMRLSRYSERRTIPYEQIKNAALPAIFLRTLIQPRIYGEPSKESWGEVAAKHRAPSEAFTSTSFMEGCHYIGIATLLLCLFGAIAKRRDRRVRILIFFIASSLLILYGTPLLRVAYHILPGFKSTRPDRIVYIFGSFAAFLGAVGLNSILDLLNARPKIFGKIVVMAALVIYIADMGSLWKGFNTFQDRWFPDKTPDSIAFLVEHNDAGSIARFNRAAGDDPMPPNSAAIHGIPDAQGRNALTLRHYGRFMNAVEPGVYQRSKRIFGFTNPDSMKKSIFALLGVRYLISDVDLPDRSSAYKGELNIYETGAATREVWIAPKVVSVMNEDAAVERISDSNFNPFAEAIVEGADLSINGNGGLASIRNRSNENIKIDVRKGSNGVLVFPETWYPEWTVMVNGWQAKVLKVDVAFLGVEIKPDCHFVEFQYVDRFFSMGTILSFAGIFLLSIIWIAEAKIHKRRAS